MGAGKVRRDVNRCSNGPVNEKKRAAPPRISISVLLLNFSSGGDQINTWTTRREQQGVRENNLSAGTRKPAELSLDKSSLFSYSTVGEI